MIEPVNLVRCTCDICKKQFEVKDESKNPLTRLILPMKYYSETGSFIKVSEDNVDVCDICKKRLENDLSEIYAMSTMCYRGVEISRKTSKTKITNKLIQDLDGADLFLRDRASCAPAVLNSYDIELFRDISNTCDEAARVLEKENNTTLKLGSTVYFFEATFGVVLPYVIEKIISTLNSNKICYTFRATAYDNDHQPLDNIEFSCEDIGTIIFATEEDANNSLLVH